MKIKKDKLSTIVAESKSYSEVCCKLGLLYNRSSHALVADKIEHLDINTSHFIKTADHAIGMKFGTLTILSVTQDRSWRSTVVICKCECGATCNRVFSEIKRGKSWHCGNTKIHFIPKESKFNDPALFSARRIYGASYLDGDLSFDNFVELSQHNCFYCGQPPAKRYNYFISKHAQKLKNISNYVDRGLFIYNGLDRVDNNLPHNLSNVVPCCYNCNTAKLDRTQEEFIAWAHRICKQHAI